MDNPKKKKLDSKRFAISQKHERDYMIKSAKKLLKQFEIDKEHAKIHKLGSSFVALNKKNGSLNEMGTKPIMRCLKVLIGILENYKKKK